MNKASANVTRRLLLRFAAAILPGLFVGRFVIQRRLAECDPAFTHRMRMYPELYRVTGSI